MTLLQTRVADDVALKFKKAAAARGLKPYALLQQMIGDVANQPAANTWKNHWQRLEKMAIPPAAVSFSESREEANER